MTAADGKTIRIRTRKSLFTDPITGAAFLFDIIQRVGAPPGKAAAGPCLGAAFRRLIR